jgi:dynein heavy chain 1, cytosolic
MKLSPFYKQFEEDANQWESRLHNIRQVFDLWMDVQRRWVYLEGIFFGSADIQQLLPQEYSKFKFEICGYSAAAAAGVD